MCNQSAEECNLASFTQEYPADLQLYCNCQRTVLGKWIHNCYIVALAPKFVLNGSLPLNCEAINIYIKGNNNMYIDTVLFLHLAET